MSVPYSSRIVCRFVVVFGFVAIHCVEAGADPVPVAISQVRAESPRKITCLPGEPANVTLCPVQCEINAVTVAPFAIAGVVTLPSGAASQSYDDQGFQISDGTAGIFVKTGTDNLGARIGDRAAVSGTPECLGGTLALGDTVVQLKTASLDLDADSDSDSESDSAAKSARAAGHQPPAVFSPRQIGGFRAEPEAVAGIPGVTPNWCDCLDPVSYTDGDLITVRGTLVTGVIADLPYGHKLFLDDGKGVAQVFIDLGTGIPVTELSGRLLKQGADLCVTGVVAQFASVGFELLPRNRGDLRRAKSGAANPCD